MKTIIVKSSDTLVTDLIKEITTLYEEYNAYEVKIQADTGVDYNIHYDLVDLMVEWCDCIDTIECKRFLQKIELEKGIVLGEFVKAVLKINNIASEMEKIAESTGNIMFLSKLREIPILIQKYVVINQSLYI